MLATEREGVNERMDRSVPRGTLLHGENHERALSSSHRGTRCSLTGSWPRITQRSRGTRLRSEWVLSPSSPAEPGTRCSFLCNGWLRRCSHADSPVGALAHRGAPLGTTHSNCNGSQRRRGPADPAVRPALGTRCIPRATGNPGAHAVSPARLQRVKACAADRQATVAVLRRPHAAPPARKEWYVSSD